MRNTVTVKQGDFYYVVPVHEFTRYWLPELETINVPLIPEGIPYASKLAGLKRGKGVKRVVKAHDQKGSGKHATNHDKTL